MRQTNKLFLLLALLLTAATGAWADTVVLGTPETSVTTLSDANGIITLTDATGSTGIQQGSSGYKIPYGDKQYTPMKLSGSRNFTLSYKAGVTINKVTLMAMSNNDAAGNVGGGDGDASSLGSFPARNTDGNCLSVDITDQTGLRFTRVALAIIVVEYSTTSDPVAAPTYTVSLADGVKDADKWTITPNEGLKEGDKVTLTYTGRLKVKGVKATSDAAAPAGKTVDLSTLTADYEAQNGDVLTGETTSYKVTIAAGATVTLDGVNISSTGGFYCIKCAGDATIILKDGSTNTLTSTADSYPALWAGDTNTTLTIQGSTGVLNVTSGTYCAGIGGGYMNTNNICGNIRIEGGVITAQGGGGGAGIGTDSGPATCGDIIITGGTITAKGGSNAAGIGTGDGSGSSSVVCGDITIANTVTKVTATKGANAPYSIGKGYGGKATCGTVTIGGNVGAITESPYTYDPSAPAPAISFNKQAWGDAQSAPANFISVSQADAKAAADAEKTQANAPGYVCIYALEDGEYKWIDSHGRTGQRSSIGDLINGDAWDEVYECHNSGYDNSIWFTVEPTN